MIELRDVTKVYTRKGADPVTALDGLSLSVEAGSIHGIVGESGAGKSTLIRCLTALERPTSGSILVAGQDLTTLRNQDLRTARRSIGMVFQGANLFESRTAFENIAYPLRIAKVPAAERESRVNELLDLVGLAGRGDSYPAQLSGGQRQRVGIARALADDPGVLLADEPTSALDSDTTAQILALLKSVRDRTGVTVVVITHEMSVVREICDSVTLLDRGTVRESGRIRDVVTNPNSELARKLIPLPEFGADAVGTQCAIDLFFTSHPGDPMGSKVMAQVQQVSGDIAAGTFETVGDVQVGRLVVTVAPDAVAGALEAFASHNIHAEVRAA